MVCAVNFSSEASISIAESFGLVAYDIKGNKLSDKEIKARVSQKEKGYFVHGNTCQKNRKSSF